MIARMTRSEFSKDPFSNNLPVIITDALHDWDLSGRWSPQALARVAQERSVMVSFAKDGTFRFKQTEDPAQTCDFSIKPLPFGEAVALIEEASADADIYIMQQSIPDALPELMANLVVPEWIAGKKHLVNLWFGTKSVSPLHFDGSNNLFAQVHGEKEFVIFSPQETEHLYPYEHAASMPHVSHVNVGSPDPQAHPRYASASGHRFTVSEGELLFLPAFWWHYVRSNAVSVSVSFWWPPEVAQFLESPNAVRPLYKMNELDRLSMFKNDWLASHLLDSAAIGRLLLDRGRTWAAALLAISAFEERVAERVDSSEALARCCAVLSERGEMSSELRARVMEHVPALSAKIRRFDDALIEPREVVAMLELAAVGSAGV